MKKLIIPSLLAAMLCVTALSSACRPNRDEEPEHIHTYSEQWSKSETQHWHKADCGHDDFTFQLAEHEGEWETVIPATETLSGLERRICAVCGYEQTRSTDSPLHTHKFSDKPQADDTYHWFPAICGHDEITGKSAHSYGKWFTAVEATETQDGLKKRKCSVCLHEQILTIPTLTHTHKYSDKPQYSATEHWFPAICGHDVVTGKNPHSFGEWLTLTEPTETQEGLERRICYVCRYAQESILNRLPHTHKFSEEWSADTDYHFHRATCGHDNVISGQESHEFNGGVCTVCGYEKSLSYTLNSDGTSYSVSGIGDIDGTEITVPRFYNNKPVTHIASNAFRQSNITKITIPDTVYSIGAFAFTGCTALTEFNFHELLDEIGDYAFKGCTSLTEITIPDSVQSVSNYAFADCLIEHVQARAELIKIFRNANLQSVIITGNGKIPSSALANCAKLADVTIEYGITEIGSYAFENCALIKEIIIPDSVVNTEHAAFRGCGIERAEVPASSLFAIGNYNANLLSVKVTSGTIINPDSLRGAVNLTEIILPDSITSIQQSAFFNCASLKNIKISSAVKEIAYDAFVDCKELEFEVDENNANYKSEQGCLLSKDGKIFIAGKAVIPDGVEELSMSAFHGRETLENIIIPESVKVIGASAFSGCVSLKEINVPSSVTKIGEYAFYGCNSLKEINVPSAVTEIGDYAFGNCPSLAVMTVAQDNAIYSSKNNCILSKDGAILYWGCKTSVIPDSVTEIRANAFANVRMLENIVIPQSVKKIGNNAFRDCTELKQIVLPQTLDELGNRIFYGCSALISVELPETLTEIPDATFADCKSLKNIAIPQSITKIGTSAFSGCLVLESITIPESVTLIGTSAFSSCESLFKVVIPDSVQGRLANTFARCYSLTEVVIGDGINSMISAFNNCINLKKVVLGKNVKTMQLTFRQCNSLTEIVLPKSVELTKDMFFNCDYLSKIYYEGTEEDFNGFQFRKPLHAELRIFYYSQTKPEEKGNFWRYAHDGKTPLQWF